MDNQTSGLLESIAQIYTEISKHCGGNNSVHKLQNILKQPYIQNGYRSGQPVTVAWGVGFCLLISSTIMYHAHSL